MIPFNLSTIGLQTTSSNVSIKAPSTKLNQISFNSSRDSFSNLFNDFKKINNNGINGGKQQQTHDSQSKTSLISDASNNDSIDLVNVDVSEYKSNKLVPLYIGDLDTNVTEEMLYNHFKKYSSLSSVKICYSPQSKDSLGYGYVNFESEYDAKRAIEDLNYTCLLGKEIRIMPSLQGKEKLFLGTNVFISNLNLPKDFTLRLFYEKFRKFGEITSCKLNKKKRQGFISFQNKETALNFIDLMNETSLDGYKIYCSIHIPKALRIIQTKEDIRLTSTIHHNETNSQIIQQASLLKEDQFKQIYVKGLPVDIKEDEIRNLLSAYGKITELFKQNVEKYNSTWCLVTFDSCSSAKLAIKNLHKTLHNGRRLTCVKALKKQDRKFQLSSASPNSSSLPIRSISASTSSPPVNSSTLNQDAVQNRSKTFKVFIENLPSGVNENFFKLFLRNYTFVGKIIKYSINPLSDKYSNYIEFEKEEDAITVNAKINGVNISGNVLVSSIGVKPTVPSHYNQISRRNSLHRENSQLSFSTLGSPVSIRSVSVSKFNPNSSATTVTYQDGDFYQPNSSSIPLFRNRNGKVFQMVPIAQHLQRNPSFSRLPSYKETGDSTSLNDSSNLNESLMERLQEASLKYIDFMEYPAATRPKNLKRIIQYFIDSQWKNDYQRASFILNKIDIDPIIQSNFRNELLSILKLLGFGRLTSPTRL